VEKGYLRSFWDFIVFNKVKDIIGGKVANMAVGSAAITNEILDFVTVYFGCNPTEGFGMTECFFTNVRHSCDFKTGSVGPPNVMIEQKLVSVPDLGYFVTDKPYPRGELLLRGSPVTLGYYKNPEQTQAAIDSEGWLHTGDVAAFKPNGTVMIIDRVKNLFKLSIGEYISPEKIEGIIGRSQFVSQSLVYGNSSMNFIVAVIIPELMTLAPLAKSLGLGESTDPSAISSICNNQTVVDTVLADIQKQFAGANIPHYEIVKGICVSPVAFTVDNGALTPTLKLRRRQAQALHQASLDSLVAKFQKQ